MPLGKGVRYRMTPEGVRLAFRGDTVVEAKNMNTERKYRSHMPPGATLSPKGDLGARRAAELDGAFPRQIKRSGGIPSNPLKYRRPETAIDAKFGPGDKICG